MLLDYKMSNIKAILLNISIIILFVVLPYAIIEKRLSSANHTLYIVLQYLFIFFTIIGSFLLIKINNKLLTSYNLKKWILYCFNVLGAVLIALSSILALAIYFFRNVGF